MAVTGEIVKKEEQSVMEFQPLQPTFSYDMDDDWEIEIPRFKLLHPVSPEVDEGLGRGGDFLIDGFGVVPSPVIVVPVARSQMRQFRLPKEVDKDEPVSCQSDDAKVGYGDPGGVCDTCAMIKACRKIYRYIVWVPNPDMNGGRAAIWELKNSGRFSAQRINGYMREHLNGGPGFAIELTSKKTEGQGGTYYRPMVKRLDIPDGLVVPQLEDIM